MTQRQFSARRKRKGACRWPSFARAPSRSQFGESFFRKTRLALVSRLGSPESWLRQSAFDAYRRIAWKILMMRHPIVVLGLTFNVHRCSLARATGLFSSHGSFRLVQRERPGKPSSSTLVRNHSTPGFNSNTSRAFCTANLKSWEII